MDGKSVSRVPRLAEVENKTGHISPRSKQLTDVVK
jgi:hypothetical protein